MTTVAKIFETMEYGPAPESASPALDWIKQHDNGRFGHYIGGRWVAPSEGQYFETINPATGRVLGTAADASLGDAKRAIETARRAFDSTTWATDHAFRAHCLRQLHEALVRHTEDLREVIVADVTMTARAGSGSSGLGRNEPGA